MSMPVILEALVMPMGRHWQWFDPLGGINTPRGQITELRCANDDGRQPLHVKMLWDKDGDVVIVAQVGIRWGYRLYKDAVMTIVGDKRLFDDEYG